MSPDHDEAVDATMYSSRVLARSRKRPDVVNTHVWEESCLRSESFKIYTL